MQVLNFTANDTAATPLLFAVTDAATGISTPTDITGFTIAMEIDYNPSPLVPLVKNATILTPGTNGRCELQWAVGDLKEGTWYGKLTITNAAGKKLSSQMMMLCIEKDITP